MVREMNYRLVKEVQKRTRKSTDLLKKAMVFLCVLFVLAGIVMDRGMMFLALLTAGMYFLYDAYGTEDYEYVMEDNVFTIIVIRGKRFRKTAHQLDLKDLEVVAPSRHQAVARYRKKGGEEKLPKFDYTSYDPDIPYYTMIITENKRKIKLLLDLEEDMLRSMKRMYPDKVFCE